MSCGESGRKKNTYTGNQVGHLNHTGEMNYVAGGPPGSGLSASTTVQQFIPKSTNRAPWLRADATFDEKLLDAAYPTIDLQWFADINLAPGVTFRVSDRSFYIMDEDGISNYYDARCDKAPSISATVGEWLAPKYQISDLSMSINNRDGLYNPYLPLGDLYSQWTNATVEIFIGFGEKRSNYLSIFQGQVAVSQGLMTTRDTIELKVNDKLEADQIPLPIRSFSSDNFPDINDDQAGKPVPLVYGDWSENVPTYGSVPAYCTNALEEDASEYQFKISDLELMSIDSVWLHRGDRTADKPQGPIRVADNIIARNETAGEFSIPSNGIVLDEPYYIGENMKAGVGTSGAVIVADNNFNFIENGVKVGDKVVNGAPSNAQVTIENLQYRATQTGTTGNNIAIEYYLLPPDNSVDQTKCYCNVTHPSAGVSIIHVGIPQGYDQFGGVTGGPVYDTRPGSPTYGKIIGGNGKASAIKSAVYANGEAKALVRIYETGTVPLDYKAGTKVTGVLQSRPTGPTYLVGGQSATYYQTIVAVSNFQITVDGTATFNAGDEYNISTVQYKFLQSDKFTVVCQGKPLSIVSVDRIPDINSDITQPGGLRITPDATIWLSDDATQRIYHLNFDHTTIETIDYSMIDSTLNAVSGIEITTDNKLWVTNPTNSTVYRFDLDTGQLGFALNTATITGLTTLANLAGIAVESDNRFWLVDKVSSELYLVDAFSSTNPYVVRHFNSNVFEVTVTEILDIAIDHTNDALVAVDRTTNYFYRFSKLDGSYIDSFPLTNIADNISFVSGVSIAQDGTIFVVDAALLTIYNYNDMDSAETNPAIIARDLLQKFGGHRYNEFDLSWMQTARQLADFKCRYVFDQTLKMVDSINGLLRQFNTVFHLRFNRYSLFFIDFQNFRTTGKNVNEGDIKDGTFKPGKETNQYFNSATANFGKDPFTNDALTSDTYVSPAAISFAGGETNKKIELPNVYRRQDLDRMMPLFVKLSVPDPEFVTMTLNFRQIRTQMQDFLNVTFDGDVNCQTGRKSSGRRYNNVPCMVRSLKYDLNFMTVEMKLWSLGNTSFPGYTAQGRTVGGVDEPIVLSNIGRLGRISPTAYIQTNDLNSITVTTPYGSTAEAETHAIAKKAWLPGYKLDLVNGSTKEIIQTLTIQTVIGNVITFVEEVDASCSTTIQNAAGFISGGTYLQYASYTNLPNNQRVQFASFTKPTINYPTSKTQELEEQRGGVHNFDDGGVPYVLYPSDFTQY